MPRVNRIANGLAYQMGADRVALEIVAFQQFAFGGDVAIVGQRLVDFKMVAPASKFQAIVAKILRHACQIFQRQIGPLTGKKCDRTRHSKVPQEMAVTQQ